jgi:hypothetical protein
MNNRRRKKIKKTSTFLKNHPDFLKNSFVEKKEPVVVSDQDMEFLKNFGGVDFYEKNDNNLFNYKY